MMIESYYNYCHQVLGTSMYTIPLIILSILALIIGLVHWKRHKKREEHFEEDLKQIQDNQDPLGNGTEERGSSL